MTNQHEQWAAWKQAIAALRDKGYTLINRGRIGGRFTIEVWRDGICGATIRDRNFIRAVAVAAQHVEARHA